MPSGPTALHLKWNSDGKAVAYLEGRGFKLCHDWMWMPPENHVYTEQDRSALDYLFLEWEYGGVVGIDYTETHTNG